MQLVTPGIRPADAEKGDQKRIMTPAKAIAAGADHLVVGRPIVEASDPKAAAEAIGCAIEQIVIAHVFVSARRPLVALGLGAGSFKHQSR